MVNHKKSSYKTEKRITRLQARLNPSLAPKPISAPPAPIREPPKWIVVAIKELAAREPEKSTATRKLSQMVRNASEEQRARWKKMAKLPEKE
ncbi:unnamed protein product [Caenorhabditis brenneri]